MIASRTQAELEQVATSIRDATGRRCLVVPTDVKQETQIVAMVERTIEEYGQIDILVNNAGGTRLGPLEELPTRGWDSIFELNVRGPFLCTREVGRHMIEQRYRRDRERLVRCGCQRGEGWRALQRGEVGPADVHTR